MSPMNPRRLVPTQEPGVLDFAPGAAAAYSLRSLSNSYAGPVVTVRRSTDSAEADFTASEVSDGTLAGWAGADGFVKQWWDQSGNARHATQATATAQPQIIDSGVLVTEGGKAAVRFDGVDDGVFYSGTGFQSLRYSVFGVAANDSAVAVRRMLLEVNDGSADSAISVVVNDGVNGYLDAGAWYPDAYTEVFSSRATSAPLNEQLLTAVIVNLQSDGDFFFNGGIVPQTTGVGRRTINQNGVTLGFQNQSSPSRFWSGTISELLFYPTDMTALRTRIEGNINRHFGVF